jgi:hypothetical protein
MLYIGVHYGIQGINLAVCDVYSKAQPTHTSADSTGIPLLSPFLWLSSVMLLLYNTSFIELHNLSRTTDLFMALAKIYNLF